MFEEAQTGRNPVYCGFLDSCQERQSWSTVLRFYACNTLPFTDVKSHILQGKKSVSGLPTSPFRSKRLPTGNAMSRQITECRDRAHIRHRLAVASSRGASLFGASWG